MRALLLLLTMTTAALAQRGTVVEATVRHGDIVTTRAGLTLPAGEFTVGEMLEACAGYLCRNYLYDPELVDGRRPFRLQRELSLDAVGAEEVLYALLASRDLAALPLDDLRGVYQVVPIDVALPSNVPMATIPWRTPNDILRRRNLRELVLTVVTLEHVDAERAAAALRGHFAMARAWRPGAPLATATDARSIILHGYGDQVARTILALRELDRIRAPQPPEPSLDAAVLQRLEALEREVQHLKNELARRNR